MITSARRLLDDLLNVEVDIVVGAEVCSDADAPTMASVIDRYEAWLVRPLAAIDASWSAFSPSDREREMVERAREGAAQIDTAWIDDRLPGIAGGEGASALLQAAASAEARGRILDTSDHPPDPEWLPVLRRIRGYLELFATLPPTGETPSVEEVRIVRKAAELGVATISAQSVVQLDGDVLLRADDESFLAPERQALRALHGSAIEAALAHWRVLVDFAGQMTMAAAALFAAILRAVRNPVAAARGWNRRRTLNARASGRSGWALFRPQEMRDTWREFARIRRELLDDGGITVDSPVATAGDEDPPPPYARTVIQPDGDALWYVRTDVTSDDDLLAAHVARVAEAYTARGAVVATLQRYLVAVQALAAAAVPLLAVAVVHGVSSLVVLAVSAVGSTGAVAAVRSAIGWFLRLGLRSAMP
jgi:hypothetical protein